MSALVSVPVKACSDRGSMLIIPIQEWLGFQVELWINSYVVFIDVLGKLVHLEAAGEASHQPSPRWVGL